MHIFLYSWCLTSLVAYIMLFVTERRTVKGFTVEDSILGLICCSIPYAFFIAGSIGLFLAYRDAKKFSKDFRRKFPEITGEDIEQYQKIKKQSKKNVNV